VQYECRDRATHVWTRVLVQQLTGEIRRIGYRSWLEDYQDRAKSGRHRPLGHPSASPFYSENCGLEILGVLLSGPLSVFIPTEMSLMSDREL
jgi:hypothetical protein